MSAAEAASRPSWEVVLAGWVSGSRAPALIEAPAHTREAILAALTAAGAGSDVVPIVIDCASLPIPDKSSLLELLAHKFSFPSWFGGTWDSLADCLSDADGTIVCLLGVDLLPRHVGETAERILQHEVALWERGGAIIVLRDRTATG